MTLEGSGFGSPGPGHGLLFSTGDSELRIRSLSPHILLWQEDRIVVDIVPAFPSGRARVRTPRGDSDEAAIEIYDYTWFDIPPTEGTNASPLSVAFDPAHGLWINQEFHLEFQHLDPIVGVVVGLEIPQPPDPGPFASTIFADHRTQTSVLGEDVVVDPSGKVWFSQGGGYLYSGEHPNHSRIVRLDPDADPEVAFRVYNIPGDWNEVIGLAWDEPRGRMWFTEGGLVSGAKVGSFDPEGMEWDNHFDFSVSLDHLVCPPGEVRDDCYQIFELPNPTAQPAHLLVHSDGSIWQTSFWGNAIGRLVPEMGEITVYPLPVAIGESDPVPIVGSGPWQILEEPGGDVVFNEFFDCTLGRFDVDRVGDPACEILGEDGRNECIEELVVSSMDSSHEQIHSIARDADGNLWFTQHADDAIETDTSVGYVTPDWAHVIRLPPFADFPGEGGPASTGIAIDEATGDIWFAEFWRQRIGRLRRVPELGE